MSEYKKIKKKFNQLAKDVQATFELTIDEFVGSNEFREAFTKFCDRKKEETL